MVVCTGFFCCPTELECCSNTGHPALSSGVVIGRIYSPSSNPRIESHEITHTDTLMFSPHQLCLPPHQAALPWIHHRVYRSIACHAHDGGFIHQIDPWRCFPADVNTGRPRLHGIQAETPDLGQLEPTVFLNSLTMPPRVSTWA